jgi:hypothetical protein
VSIVRPGSRASQIHSNARHRCLRLCHGPVFSSTPLISIFPAVYSLFDCSKYLHACPSGIFRKIPLGPTGNTPGLAVVRTDQSCPPASRPPGARLFKPLLDYEFQSHRAPSSRMSYVPRRRPPGPGALRRGLRLICLMATQVAGGGVRLRFQQRGLFRALHPRAR